MEDAYQYHEVNSEQPEQSQNNDEPPKKKSKIKKILTIAYIVLSVLALDRYVVKDWGNIGIDDWDLNNQALLDGTRIFASYQTCKGDIWIITEADRSATTVLFPDEY